MNDVFDICNGRFVAAGINMRNWGKKHDTLTKFLKILQVTEDSYKEEMQLVREKRKVERKKKSKTKSKKNHHVQDETEGFYEAGMLDDGSELHSYEVDPVNDCKVTKMFMATTTLRSWRITVLSTIALTEKMLNAGYFTVLTGKLNQDPIEVNNKLLFLVHGNVQSLK